MKLLLSFVLIFMTISNSYSKSVKIGFLLSTLQEERYQKDKKYFEDEAKHLGAEVIFFAANNNEQEQVKKMENLLSKKVDVIVVQPVNSDAASSLVEMASELHIPVIAYDRIINNAPIAYYVTQNSKEVGRLQAEAAVAATHGKGNYVVLSGQAGHSVANAITEGVMEVLKKHPDIKVVLQKNHDGWRGQLAMNTVENVLTQHKGKIDAILANNSGMANGAVQAVSDFDKKLLGKIFIAGADADLSSMKNLVSGGQQFEVLKDIKELATTSAQVAVSVASGQKIMFDTEEVKSGKFIVPVINTAVFPVTKDTILSVVVKRGFHSKKDIYGK